MEVLTQASCSEMYFTENITEQLLTVTTLQTKEFTDLVEEKSNIS